MQERGEAPRWPDNPAPYLTDWLFEVGPSASAAMGEGPLAIHQIAADLAALGIEAEPWELRLLRELSCVHVAERSRARKSGCPSPLDDDPLTAAERVKRQFKAMLRAMTKR